MTGYSNVRTEEPEFSLTVSLKSTNHRFLDLQFRLPSALDTLEAGLRRQVKDRMPRGHVEVMVTFERGGAQVLQLNNRMLEGYVQACDGLRAHFGALAAPDPVALLRVPGMIVSDGEMPVELMGRIRTALERLTEQALSEHESMRAAEGKALERDIRSRFARLAELVGSVEGLAGRVPELYRHRLETRLKDFTDGGLSASPRASTLEPGRLAQEVLYLVSRSDISEELVRLKSHLEQAVNLVSHGREVGKKLDFLLQELNREANTILSKTTDVPEAGPQIAQQAIEMKTEIEKLREQAQNIE